MFLVRLAKTTCKCASLSQAKQSHSSFHCELGSFVGLVVLLLVVGWCAGLLHWVLHFSLVVLLGGVFLVLLVGEGGLHLWLGVEVVGAGN